MFDLKAPMSKSVRHNMGAGLTVKITMMMMMIVLILITFEYTPEIPQHYYYQQENEALKISSDVYLSIWSI